MHRKRTAAAALPAAVLARLTKHFGPRADHAAALYAEADDAAYDRLRRALQSPVLTAAACDHLGEPLAAVAGGQRFALYALLHLLRAIAPENPWWPAHDRLRAARATEGFGERASLYARAAADLALLAPWRLASGTRGAHSHTLMPESFSSARCTFHGCFAVPPEHWADVSRLPLPLCESGVAHPVLVYIDMETAPTYNDAAFVARVGRLLLDAARLADLLWQALVPPGMQARYTLLWSTRASNKLPKPKRDAGFSFGLHMVLRGAVAPDAAAVVRLMKRIRARFIELHGRDPASTSPDAHTFDYDIATGLRAPGACKYAAVCPPAPRGAVLRRSMIAVGLPYGRPQIWLPAGRRGEYADGYAGVLAPPGSTCHPQLLIDEEPKVAPRTDAPPCVPAPPGGGVVDRVREWVRAGCGGAAPHADSWLLGRTIWCEGSRSWCTQLWTRRAAVCGAAGARDPVVHTPWSDGAPGPACCVLARADGTIALVCGGRTAAPAQASRARLLALPLTSSTSSSPPPQPLSLSDSGPSIRSSLPVTIE